MRWAFVLLAAFTLASAGRCELPVFGRDAIRYPGPQANRTKTCPIYNSTEPVHREVQPGDSVHFSYAVTPAPEASGIFTFSVRLVSSSTDTVIFTSSLTRGEGRPGWRDRRIDLSSWAGQSVALHFDITRSTDAVDPAFEMKPAYFGGVRVGNFKRKPGELNVVLISLDTLRADHLGCYGYKKETSPSIDRLAHRGALFYENISQSPWTKPSHASIFTGLNPSWHRSLKTSAKRRDRMQGTTIAERLRDAGYLTLAMTGALWVSAEGGFFRGFDRFEDNRYMKVNAGTIFNQASKWIEENKDERFFLFLHTYEIHGPYRHTKFGKGPIERYDSGIHYTDKAVGRFLSDLKLYGLREDTLVILTSDHGEDLGTHFDEGTHGHSLFDELLRVPLIMSCPSRIKPRFISGVQSRNIDIFPTILDLLKLPPEPGIHGESLVPYLDGKEAPRENFAISEGMLRGPERKSVRYTLDDQRYKIIVAPKYVFKGSEAARRMNMFSPRMDDRQGRQATEYVENNNELEFFDLTADPGERRNLSGKGGPIMEKLLGHVYDYVTSVPERSQASEEEEDDENVVIDPAVEEDLRALGY